MAGNAEAKRRMMLTFMIVLIVVNVNPKASASAKSEHPLLYYSKNDENTLRSNAKTSHHEIFQRLREAAKEMKRNPNDVIPSADWAEFSKSWNENYGNNLAALAFYCVLNTSDGVALNMVKTAISRFTNLKNWRSVTNLDDDVPVSHSLVAMATAYDFLWNNLDERQQESTRIKIANVTEMLYKRSFDQWWGQVYIQNHMATNYVAMLTGALVVQRSNKQARLWVQRAHKMLNRTMFLLGFVKDGSLQEGVSYASYTTRSLTQYIFLAKRHLRVDLSTNSWLQKHFEYIYRTILPSFDKTLGIADSNGEWFYGPQSQLVFLDRFVLKNGLGNRLAKQISHLRRYKKAFSLARAHRFATLHTEFLFYDNNIEENYQQNCSTPSLYVFEDWGVAIYGHGAKKTVNDLRVSPNCSPASTSYRKGVLKQKKQDVYTLCCSDAADMKPMTFVSFKCGVLHGQAINRIVQNKPWSWIKGWKSFNPGHEHPDHGSFTFYPNNVPFITEALYGPKYTWLNNVLTFGVSSNGSENFFGQISEGNKWLEFKNERYWKAKANIAAAVQDGDNIYIAGEYSEWYPKILGLRRLYRSIILIRQDVLLVCDVIIKTPNSKANKMSAFFHNRFTDFKIHAHEDGQKFAKILHSNRSYVIQWATSFGSIIDVKSRNKEFQAEYGKRNTNFLNVTSHLEDRITHMVYVLSDDNSQITSLRLMKRHGQPQKTTVTLTINNKLHNITITHQYRLKSVSNQRFKDYVNINVYQGLDNSNLKSSQSPGIKILFIALIIVCLFALRIKISGSRFRLKLIWFIVLIQISYWIFVYLFI